MTFTEAAVEVLRRAGKPLHFREIAELALKENLLSHVGQDPEITMGQRLAAMSKREEDRKVVAVSPDGVFALLEWGVPQEMQVEPLSPPMEPADAGEATYRPKEREPRPIHAQARRRLAELQAEHEEGYEEAEAERRRQEQARKPGQRRFPPPAEVVFEALAQRQTGSALSELAQDLLKRQLLSEALVRDLPSLVAALLEDNRRRTEAGRKPAFIVDGERVTLVEFPPPSAVPELAEARVPHGGARPMSAAQLVAEGRRAVTRALRRRLAELETSAFESLCAMVLERMGMRDVRVAKRSKEGPLYLARQRRGVSDLRVAVKLVRGGREIGRPEVQELRKDLAHYSAQMGLVLAAGDAGREARSEASAAGQPPVALYTGEALPEEMIACRVGVTVQTVEVPDIDEAFFAAVTRRDEKRAEPDHERARREREPRSAEESAPHAPAEPPLEVAKEKAAPPGLETAGGPPADAPPPESIESAVPAPAEDSRDGRKRPRGREERPRATSAADQAWGQPAGTLRFAPRPGPTVVAAEEPERPPDPDAAQETAETTSVPSLPEPENP